MTDQITQLAAQQVAQDTQAVAPQPAVQTEQASAPVQSVPYNRFQEVIQQKNELAQRLAAIEAQIGQQPQVVQQDATPQLNTVDDLLNVVRQDVKKELDQAYASKLKPIEEQFTRTSLVNNVERFYASQPEAAKVRGQIDQYFDTLPADYQNFIKSSVIKGDSSVLNNLYYAVIAQNRTQSNQVVQQNVQRQAPTAGSPSPYMTINATPISFQEKIKNASQGGAYSGRNTDGWESVMMDVLNSSS